MIRKLLKAFVTGGAGTVGLLLDAAADRLCALDTDTSLPSVRVVGQLPPFGYRPLRVAFSPLLRHPAKVLTDYAISNAPGQPVYSEMDDIADRAGLGIFGNG